MEGILKVSPEELQVAAEEFGNRGNKIAILMNEMINMVDSIGGHWQGEASLTYTTKFKNLQTDINKMNGIIQSHVEELKTMSEHYQKVENRTKEIGESLLGEIL